MFSVSDDFASNERQTFDYIIDVYGCVFRCSIRNTTHIILGAQKNIRNFFLCCSEENEDVRRATKTNQNVWISA